MYKGKINLIGQRFGMLVVVADSDSGNWLCKCDCGKERIAEASRLTSGKLKTCGTHRKANNKTHGMRGTRIYNIWKGIKKRCNNPNDKKNYKYYGGRGIKVHPAWSKNFLSFYNWAIFNGYSEELQIDRIDPDGDYCPENCRWITKVENIKRKRKQKPSKK